MSIGPCLIEDIDIVSILREKLGKHRARKRFEMFTAVLLGVMSFWMSGRCPVNSIQY